MMKWNIRILNAVWNVCFCEPEEEEEEKKKKWFEYNKI